MALTADDIKSLLKLTPHPTCGFVAETYRSAGRIPQRDLPQGFDGPRALGSVLYFMVTPAAHIAMHRILSDQMYHHYAGDPLEVLLLYPDGTGEVRVMGGDLAAGMRPQLVVPARTFHMSRLRPPRHHRMAGRRGARRRRDRRARGADRRLSVNRRHDPLVHGRNGRGAAAGRGRRIARAVASRFDILHHF